MCKSANIRTELDNKYFNWSDVFYNYGVALSGDPSCKMVPLIIIGIEVSCSVFF